MIGAMNNSNYPTLYSFRRCPYAMRARMALSYSNIQTNLIEVSLKNKPEKMLELSPKETVPVLHLTDGKVFDESRDIMLWALSNSDSDKWYFGLDKIQQIKIDNLISHNDENFKPLLDRYKYAIHYPDYSELEFRKAAERFLKQLNRLLNKNKYLFSDNITLADIAIFPFIRQFAFVDKKWFDESDYVVVQQWLNGFLDSDLYQNIMHE